MRCLFVEGGGRGVVLSISIGSCNVCVFFLLILVLQNLLNPLLYRILSKLLFNILSIKLSYNFASILPNSQPKGQHYSHSGNVILNVLQTDT